MNAPVSWLCVEEVQSRKNVGDCGAAGNRYVVQLKEEVVLPPLERKNIPSGRGKFKLSWKLPERFGSSSSYAYCKLCRGHITFLMVA